MIVRIITNIFNGDYKTRKIDDGLTSRELLSLLKLNESCAAVYDGEALVEDHNQKLSCQHVTVKIMPGGLTTVLSTIGIVVSAVALGLTIYSYFNQPKISKVQTSPSLRGSQNAARQNSRLPILLGRHRVYPDVAALPYTSYASHDQYLHQLFCFGYNNVAIDIATLKIGETPVASYDGVTYDSGFATIYPYRCIESTINVKLANDGTATPVIRNTASGTYQIRVGLSAPSGIYKFNDDGDRETYNISYRIEWRVPDETWQIAVEQTIGLNVDKWCQSFKILPTGADDGQYEVRVTRTSAVGTNSSINDYLYWDVLQCLTADADGQTSPVPNYGRYCLLSTKIKATNQLNGVVDSLNAMATLRTRMYLGSGTGADAWAVAETRNPASAILYLLTDPYANPKPISDAQIDWAEFEEFYEFCENNSLTCDAWITGEYTVLQLCQYIAQSNMAELRLSPNLIGIRIDQENVLVSQMFTPRNAWAFNMEMSFADPVRNLRLKYVDADLGYVEVERLISINDENEIVYDAEQDGDDLEVTCIGITSAEHAAKLGALRLKQTHLRRRTYTWKTDIEGIICVPGDVVLIENDNFMLGLGEARIKRLVANDDGDIAAVVVDSELKMEDGSSYGLQIRNKAAMISAPLTTKAGSRKTLYFSTPVESGSVEEGDLVSFGYYQSETLKVMVTKISYDSNHACSFTAIEYAPECYDVLSDSIPVFNPGISKYSDVSPGISIDEPHISVSKPAHDGASPKMLYIRAATQPAIPTGSSPSGWSTDVPTGTTPIWMSSGLFRSSGTQVGSWSTPIRMSGIDAGSYRGTSATDPTNPLDKDYYLYTGTTTADRIQYHYYRYSAIDDAWAETKDSDVVQAGLSDAMSIARQTGDMVYASAIFTDLLAAMHLIMTGAGVIEGGYTEDESGKPLGGYKLSAIDGTVRAVGALLRNVRIQDGYADFGALRIEPEAATGHTVIATSDNDQAKTIRDLVIGIDPSLDGKILSCSIGGTPTIKYLKTYWYEWTSWGFGGNETNIYLYDESFTNVATIARNWSSSNGISSSGVLPGSPEVVVYTGGNKMLVDLPTSSLGLEQGRVWIDDGALKVVQ